MDWKEMNVAQTNRSGGPTVSFETWEALYGAGYTPAILIPDIQQAVTVTVTATVSVGYFKIGEALALSYTDWDSKR